MIWPCKLEGKIHIQSGRVRQVNRTFDGAGDVTSAARKELAKRRDGGSPWYGDAVLVTTPLGQRIEVEEAMTLQELTDVVNTVTGSDNDISSYDEEERADSLSELREKLLNAVTYCENAVAGNRYVADIQVRGANVYIVGSPSWGDMPEGVEEFLLFSESPAYEAAGFEHQIFVKSE